MRQVKATSRRTGEIILYYQIENNIRNEESSEVNQ